MDGEQQGIPFDVAQTIATIRIITLLLEDLPPSAFADLSELVKQDDPEMAEYAATFGQFRRNMVHLGLKLAREE